MSDKLTTNELPALFGRTPDDTRSVTSADSDEYVTLVRYLVERTYRR